MTRAFVAVRRIPGGTAPEAVTAGLAVVAEWPAAAPGPSGRPEAVAPTPAGTRAPPSRAPRGTAVVLATSGSTGSPRWVALPAAALLASARATHEALGGPGRWLLALGVERVAGWQVLVRSALAGTEPVPLGAGPFRAADLTVAVARLGTSGRRYTALVPTQLARALADPAASAALASLDAVLVGGAALPGPLHERARAAGVRVVSTYGMTETGGGCVYDGRPLPGVTVEADDDGRLVIGGPTLALGYLGPDGSQDLGDPDGPRFETRAGERRLRTCDLGAVSGGLVTVHGRADDVLNTGGVKVAPGPVEEVLRTLPGVRDAVVVGLADPEWGQSVTAVLTLEAGAGRPALADVRCLVAARLGPAAAPRELVVVGELPVTAAGKIDRAAATRLAADILARP